MAVLLHLLHLLCFSILFHGRTASLLLPLTKDLATNQYLATLLHGSPATPTPLAVDLGGPSLWLACATSTSTRPLPPRSILCVVAAGSGSTGGGACQVRATNPFGALEAAAVLVEDTVAVRSLDRFMLHSCAPRLLLQGLAKSARGILGLGRTQISLPAQTGFHRRFSVCLSAKTGVVFAGSGRNLVSVYGSEISSSLTYTPILSKRIDGSQSPEYFINVKSIKVAGIRLDLDKSLLDLDGGGGGTRLSTVAPYTVLESSIFESVTAAFVAAMGAREVAPVAPFGRCFAPENMAVTEVPKIELILQSEIVGWKIEGRNSMVEVGDGVFCLAFIDGGSAPENAVVLGGYQMEDVVLDFDMGSSMLGFSSSLLQRGRSCSEFSPESLLRRTG